MGRASYSTPVYKILYKALVIASLFLAVVFVLHEALPHDHPEEIFGSGFEAALHGGSKEWWALLLLVLVAGAAFFGLPEIEHMGARRKSFLDKSSDTPKLFDPFRIALRRGILHPKGW